MNLLLGSKALTELPNIYSPDMEIVQIDQKDTSNEIYFLSSNNFQTHDLTAEAACEDELVETLNYDMSGLHEGNPAGAPDVLWAKQPRVGMGEDPGEWQAMTAWGQLYEDAAGNPATNTRVQIKNIQAYMLSKRDGQWYLLQRSTVVKGAAYREDYTDNVHKPADIRYEQDGSISVKAGEGYNFHFWPPDRASINPNDIAGIVTSVQARLIIDDPQQPDDRTEARYLLNMGGDYWESLNAQWDYWTTNGDIGQGKFKYVTSEWQYFTMNTLSPAEICQNPPPLLSNR